MKDLSKEYQNTPAEYGVQFTKHLDKILATSTVKVASIIWEVCTTIIYTNANSDCDRLGTARVHL